MENQIELFEFLCKVIDIQIKKYVSLATFGVGPDARLNAKLVVDEVNELLELAVTLISDIEYEPQDETIKLDRFTTVFNQVKFYIEQEHIRAYAGWLLSENNIHSEVKERVEEQLDKLTQIGKKAGIECSLPSQPTTPIQQQCEFDSCSIAFYILDLAKKIKDNPEIELDSKIPAHAQKILKKNAVTRYRAEEFAQPIIELHEKYDQFLHQSALTKSVALFSKEEAKINEVMHKEKWQHVLERYKTIKPNAKLFAPDQEWYKVAANPPENRKPNSLFSSRNLTLFGGITVVAVCMLIAFFVKQNHQNSIDLGLKH